MPTDSTTELHTVDKCCIKSLRFTIVATQQDPRLLNFSSAALRFSYCAMAGHVMKEGQFCLS